MKKCKYNGNPIYAFNVIGKNETINYGIEREWKKASENNQLVCDECNAPVIFRCGKIYKPHFAHKSEFQGGNPCTYSIETEEHIEGKKLLMKYMLNLYQDAFVEMRYKLPEKRKADLYIKFKDGQELVIEFQRQMLSVGYWDEKREFYRRLGLNNIWLLSGKKEEFDELIREYQLSFWNRMVLNDLDNRILYLNVENEEITIVKKITVLDEDTKEIIYDTLYNRTYPLEDINILPNGDIQCDFDKGFNLEKDKRVRAYLEQKRSEQEEKERLRREVEELERKRMEEREKRLKEEQERLERAAQEKNKYNDTEEKTDVFSEIGYTRKSYNTNSYKSYPKKSYDNFTKDENFYRDKVNKAILGYKYGIDNLVGILTRGGSTEYKTIKRLFQEQIDKGNPKAKAIFNDVMKKAGLD